MSCKRVGWYVLLFLRFLLFWLCSSHLHCLGSCGVYAYLPIRRYGESSNQLSEINAMQNTLLLTR
jgi:hypothetical protein